MILLYHNVIPDDSPPERWSAGQAVLQSAFERQIKWLVKHHHVVSLSEYVLGLQQPGFLKSSPVAVTFDDGFRVAFQCAVPFLIEMSVPVTIFMTTGHLENEELLWFSYIKALCFENSYTSIRVNQHDFSLQTMEQRIIAFDELRALARTSNDSSDYCRQLSETYPLDPDVTALYAGMTHEQIMMAGQSGILDLGSHTVTHPYLTQVSRETQEKEIVESRRILSELSGRHIRYFAYPGGEYNRDTLELVKTAGYEAAFAVIPKKIGDARFEIGRIGVYSQSLLKFQLKTMGVADLARRLGLKVG